MQKWAKLLGIMTSMLLSTSVMAQAGGPGNGTGGPGNGTGADTGRLAGQLPPGLAKKGDKLPPGLAKRATLPPGLTNPNAGAPTPPAPAPAQ